MKKLIISMVICFSISSQTNKNTGLFILSLTRYFQWPIEKTYQFFRISVYGDFSFYKNILESTLGRNVGSLNIEVSQLNRLEEIKILNPQIIVIADNKCCINNISSINKIIGNNPTLIICLKKGSINYGADIELDFENEKINFNYNKISIINKGIKISKQLDMYIK